MKKIVLAIGGMTCSACSNGLEKYLNKQEGIQSASVNLVMANALIEYDDTKIDRKKLDEFVKKAGFSLNNDLWDSISIKDEKDVKTSSFFTVYNKYFQADN